MEGGEPFFSSASDDGGGGFHARLREQGTKNQRGRIT
jgi:hypothetical protein